MRTVLNILSFVLDGFAIALGWLLATLVGIVLISTLLLTRPCQEVTKLLPVPCGNEATHVDELNPVGKNALLNTGDAVLNVFWLIFFGWWLCLMHIITDIAQHISIISILVGVANFKIAAIALWPVGHRVVSVETVQATCEASARHHFQ